MFVIVKLLSKYDIWPVNMVENIKACIGYPETTDSSFMCFVTLKMEDIL